MFGLDFTQFTLDVLQVLIDDIHAEVENEVLDALSQGALALFHLEDTAQLVIIDTQLGGQLTDFRIGMLHEILLRLETLVARMFHCLTEDAVEALIAE